MIKELFSSYIEDVSQSLEMCFLIKILHYGSTCILPAIVGILTLS